MPRTVGGNFLDALRLIGEGHTPQEVTAMGIPQATVYRAAKMAKKGYIPQTRQPPPLAVVDAETGEDLGDKVVQSDSTIPIVNAKVQQRSRSVAGATFVQDFYDPDATALMVMTKALRIPMPSKVPTLMAIAKTEWGLGDVPLDKMIDAVIEQFLLDRGYITSAWTTLKEAEEYLKEAKQHGGTQISPANTSGQPGAAAAGGSAENLGKTEERDGGEGGDGRDRSNTVGGREESAGLEEGDEGTRDRGQTQEGDRGRDQDKDS